MVRSRSIFDRLQLRVFFLPAPTQLLKKIRHSTIKSFVRHYVFFLTRKMSFIYRFRFLNSLLSMWALTKRISLRISSVLSKVEPEAGPLHRLRLRPKSTGSDRLRNTDQRLAHFGVIFLLLSTCDPVFALSCFVTLLTRFYSL